MSSFLSSEAWLSSFGIKKPSAQKLMASAFPYFLIKFGKPLWIRVVGMDVLECFEPLKV